MLNNFASTQSGGKDTVTTTTILDGTIANADVASDAAIAVSKIDFGNTLEIETSSGDQIFEMDNNASNSVNFQIQNGAGNARADLALDGSAIITLKNQMVGIGDTSPSYALDVNTTGRFTTDLIVGGNLTVGDGGAEDQKVVFNGNAQDFYVGLDDSADDLVIGLGSAVGTTPSISINSDRDVTISDGAIDFDIASHDTSNGLKLGGTLVTSTAAELNLLDGKSSVGDASGPGSATDNAIARFDGTGGKTLQNSTVTISDDPPVVKVGDGTAEDTMLAFDGNALDFHISLDDSADDLVIGTGTTAGTATLISINGDGSETKFNQPKITIGDATAEDTYIIFDGNAQDFRIGLDDGTDTLEIGGGAAHGTAAGISMDVNGDMTLGGGMVCSDEVISRPEIKDYSESYTASSGTGTVTLDMTNGNVFQHTASGGNVTFAFSNPPTTGKAGSLTLKWIQDSSDRTITWPGAVDWAGGSAPSVTSGSGKVDMYTFLTVDAGTTWYGFQAGADLS